MTQTRHFPPAGGNILDHKMSADCACKPVRSGGSFTQSSSGRGGKHQGYKSSPVIFRHNALESVDA